MSHVVSSQPSSTSPYQPTATQEVGKPLNQTITLGDTDTSVEGGDCCFRPRKEQDCCVYAICRALASCCGSLRACTDSCFEACASTLVNCCEDEPNNRRANDKVRRYKKYTNKNNANDSYWVADDINSGEFIEQVDNGEMSVGQYVGAGDYEDNHRGGHRFEHHEKKNDSHNHKHSSGHDQKDDGPSHTTNYFGYSSDGKYHPNNHNSGHKTSDSHGHTIGDHRFEHHEKQNDSHNHKHSSGHDQKDDGPSHTTNYFGYSSDGKCHPNSHNSGHKTSDSHGHTTSHHDSGHAASGHTTSDSHGHTTSHHDSGHHTSHHTDHSSSHHTTDHSNDYSADCGGGGDSGGGGGDSGGGGGDCGGGGGGDD